MKKLIFFVALLSVGSVIYAVPPANVLTNSTPSPTLAGPQADNNGFIIKDSNSKVQAYKQHKQEEKAATQEALKDQQKGIYPILQKSPDPYGLNPSTNNH